MVNRSNYLLVKKYLLYLEEVSQLRPTSLERYKFYLKHLLIWADESLLSNSARINPSFPKYVASLNGRRGELHLSMTTQKKIINTTKRFLLWAKGTYPKKFKTLSEAWINALHPPRISPQTSEHVYVSLDEVLQLISVPVDKSDIALKRDQAAAAMLYLSGMRATAFTSTPIEAVDLENNRVKQWPELGVRTKNEKRATTYLLPIPELMDVVKIWNDQVKNELSPTARWYAPVKSNWGEQTLSTDPPGKNRSQALSKRLKILFEAADLEYKSPHKFRHGHAVYGLQHARTMADFKAVSQNLGHSDIKITDQIYARILSEEVAHRIGEINQNSIYHPQNNLTVNVNNLSDLELSQLMKEAALRLSQR